METLLELVQEIRDCFGVYLYVHDVSGVTYGGACLNLPYDWKQHGGSYCLEAKRCVGVERCMLQKQLVMRRLKHNGTKPFWGVCNMGVCEYILPVQDHGHLLAVIFASGVTEEDAPFARERLERFLTRGGYPDGAAVLARYDAFAQETRTTRKTLAFLARLARSLILRSAVAYDSRQEDDFPVEAVRRKQSGMVRAVLAYIEGNYAGPVTLKELSSVFFVSEGHLCRVFQREMGMSIIRYVRQTRIHAAARLLLESGASVNAIARQTGFTDANYFCRSFKAVMGVTPSDYRRERLPAP